MKITKEDLVKKLKKSLEDNEVTYEDWYSQTGEITDALDQSGMSLTIDKGEFEGGDGYTTAVYWSEKLGKSIIVHWDCYAEVESIDGLVDLLVDYEMEGIELDKRIIRAKKDDIRI